MQRTFCPLSYGFRWTVKNGEIWYEFDRVPAHKAAMAARNRAAKQAREQGYTVTKFRLPDQLMTRGGIGSGKPEINVTVTGYGFNAYKREG